MLRAQGQVYAKNMAFYVPVGCVRFAGYCGKMYSCHLFPYGGCKSGGWISPPMSRISRPVPDATKLPDYHYKDVFESCGGEGDDSLMTGSLDITSKNV